MPHNQTFELSCSDSGEPGHIIIALNDAMPAPLPDRVGFNLACLGVRDLFVALNERMSGNHFLALAAMCAEYMRVLENNVVRDEETRILRSHARETFADMRETAAERGLIFNARGCQSGRFPSGPRVGHDASIRDLESLPSDM